ncbi:hypothetical protein K435DRAFT_806492 [Dendrothele bispora CBS 962.96]|uniref:Uncharacterized protein n=1 Tax=Dendrothele bispora (strain CBS 962.96) TaxID=1314807 RepID=A0A4S8L7T7_DENBC|nr:hypothetical protein K435DRAFT_806492 [Dendrothele bispora CBS 962.96]
MAPLSKEDDSSASLQGLPQSLRLWNRAFESLSKLHVPLAPNSSENSSPFEVSSLRNALPTETPQTLQDQTKYSTVIHEPTGMAHLSSPSGIRVHSQSSIPSREAQYFTDQVRDLAEALNASALICRAPARNGELAMLQGKLEVGLEEVEQLDQKLEGVP